MGDRGPRPEPTSFKKAKGNPGKRRLNDDEPIPPKGEIEPPAWLVGKGREVWNVLAPTARAMQVLTTADVMTFGRYCSAFGEWLDLTETIRVKFNGVTTYTRYDSNGQLLYVGELPQAQQVNRLHKTLLKYEAEFGFTPSARTRIKVERAVAAAAPAAAPEVSDADERRRRFFQTRGQAPPPKRIVAGA